MVDDSLLVLWQWISGGVALLVGAAVLVALGWGGRRK